MNRKIFIAHIILLSVILFWAYLLAAIHFRQPANGSGMGCPNLMEVSVKNREMDSSDTHQLTGDFASQDLYSHLDRSPIFDVIIPKPTSTPTPTPPPPIPPDIDTIGWKVTCIYKNTAVFQDPRNKSEWTMTVGDSNDIMHGNRKWAVKLEKINEDKFEVIISLGDQKKTISMW
jgi:hypothetical protein